jgi:hypothetical protein
MAKRETTCCQRRSGRADDEGNDLLLSSDRGGRGGGEQGGGSSTGRKGSGGAWGSTSRTAGGLGAGRASPAKWPIAEYWQKISQAVGRRAVGYNLVVLENAFLQSSCKYQTHFLAPPYEQLTRCLVLWSKDAMRVIVF